MKYKKSDYKGKYFVLQDTIDPDDWMDIEIGEIDEKEITDSWLKNHVENCMYYGIPSYHGENKELIDRIAEFEQQYEEEHKE